MVERSLWIYQPGWLYQPIAPLTIQSAALKTALGQRWELLLEVANVTDEDAVDFWGYPRPGRAYYGTVRLQLP